MFHIYKASITEYRILDTESGGFITTDAKGLTIKDPRFIVEAAGFLEAKKKSFKNSGDPFDYFAYIECEEIPLITDDIDPELIIKYNFKQVKFNPFKFDYFFDNETLSPINEAATCVISGNFLAYQGEIS